MRVQLTTILAALFLTACGPQYETQTTMVPPCSMQGKACAGQCYQSLSLCTDACHAQRQACESTVSTDNFIDNLFDPETTVTKKTDKNGNVTKIVKTSNRSADYSPCEDSVCRSHCQAALQSCYGQCGGQVINTTICVANCEKVSAAMLNPAPIPPPGACVP